MLINYQEIKTWEVLNALISRFDAFLNIEFPPKFNWKIVWKFEIFLILLFNFLQLIIIPAPKRLYSQ